jgi:hypothetical protein
MEASGQTGARRYFEVRNRREASQKRIFCATSVLKMAYWIDSPKSAEQKRERWLVSSVKAVFGRRFVDSKRFVSSRRELDGNVAAAIAF